MASHLLSSTPFCTLAKFQKVMFVSKQRASTTNNATPLKPLQLVSSIKSVEKITTRRSGNYPPSIWDYNYIQSLNGAYTEESYKRQAEKLKKDVRLMLDKVSEPLDQLKLIDDLQRLGIYYHFEDAIKKILNNIYITRSDEGKQKSLFFAALEFRLLRQHGFHVPQEIFIKFKDEMGNFKKCLGSDIEGILSLYEASYHSVQGESILEDARNFTTRHLVENLNRQDDMDQVLVMQISHALELPQHWMIQRQETRWFIEVYAMRSDANPILLELAKLDFNMVQAIHQEDLKFVSRWWRHTGLGEKLSFTRDSLVECFLWTVGVIFEPQYAYCRRMLTKINALVTVIDDIYDVYGTLDELVLFTNVVERWDINAMEQLPEYMKICFLTLFNSINEMAYDVLKEQGYDITPYLKKMWADLCKCYLVEAKWYYSEYIPTFDEYINNACTSISLPCLVGHIYFFLTKSLKNDGLDYLERYANVIHWSSMILRLADDLGTSSDELKRGDVMKSIQCYMHETGASENDAREYIKNLIGETWKKMNEDRFADSQFSQTYISTAINYGRMAQFMYQHGDGHGVSNRETRDRVLSLLIEPINL